MSLGFEMQSQNCERKHAKIGKKLSFFSYFTGNTLVQEPLYSSTNPNPNPNPMR